MIEIDNLHKRYRTADGRFSEVLKGLSLRVPTRSITAVVGPSGAGKSTLARLISLLERPDSGSIRVNGNDLSLLSGEALRRERRTIGTVFQSSALLSRKTAWQNIALPLEYLGVVERDIKARVGELLESVGLSHKADAWPAQLSGGQRQRIGIARALALRPSVLLADEATSGLDPQATAAVLNLLKRLRDEYRLAIVLITHEMDAVRAAADAVAEIRDGAIVQFGQVKELLARPDSLLGQQLLPLSPVAAHSDLLLRLSYRWDVPVATDWISRLSQQFALQIDLLGGHVETINGRLAGRLQVGVRFQGERLPAARCWRCWRSSVSRRRCLTARPNYRRRYETFGNQPGYPLERDPYAAAARLRRNLADGGHCDAVCGDPRRRGRGGAIQCLAARIIPACRAVPGVELGSEYGALSAVSGADGGDYSFHLLAHRDDDWHSGRRGADDCRRGAIFWPAGGKRAARTAGGGHRRGDRLRRLALADYPQRPAE